MQLKATSTPLEIANGKVSFDLPIKNYNDLRRTDTTVPQLLVVMQLPNAPEEWLSVAEDSTIIRKCAWWTDLWGMPSSTNTASVRIKIGATQTFSNTALTQIMDAMAKIAAGQSRKPLHEL